jgi:23S rRNA (uracil1939-C5)-methyltransferase/tRNA (uracil-5-)-methyltransferase
VAVYFRRGTPRAAATLPELGSVDEPPDGGQADEQDGAPDKKPRRRGKERKWEGPLAYHQELTLRVDSLTNLGQGVCRMEDGWVIFVPFVIPGELVRLRVWRNHKNYSEADLLEVLEPSESRVTPHCQVRRRHSAVPLHTIENEIAGHLNRRPRLCDAMQLFGTCGGCQYQHMQLTAQREWKQRHVRDVLERTGTLSGISVKPVMGTEHAFGYRTKITPHHEKPRKVRRRPLVRVDDACVWRTHHVCGCLCLAPQGEIMAIGFQRVGSRMLVDVEQCPIATPALNQRLATLRQEVREAARRDW